MYKRQLLWICLGVLLTATAIWAQNTLDATTTPTATHAQPTLPPSGAVDARQGMALMDAGTDLYILDVRSPEEYAQGHLAAAHLIPLPALQNNIGSIPADTPVLIVCRTGRRAKAAFETLRAVRRPDVPLWYLHAKPSYDANGTFMFVD